MWSVDKWETFTAVCDYIYSKKGQEITGTTLVGWGTCANERDSLAVTYSTKVPRSILLQWRTHSPAQLLSIYSKYCEDSKNFWKISIVELWVLDL